MAVSNQWAELVKCPNCGQSGRVQLSQPKGRIYDISVEAVPIGFNAVSTAYSESFFCEACDREADTFNI